MGVAEGDGVRRRGGGGVLAGAGVEENALDAEEIGVEEEEATEGNGGFGGFGV